MKITVKSEPNCKKILEIEVPREDFETEFQKQLLQYRSEAKIPGFRPGKAPKEIIEKRFSDNIKADALESLLPKAYNEAIAQENLNPISQPIISEVKSDDSQPISFKVQIEIKPEINLKEYTGHSFERKVREVTDTDIEETLKQLQDRYAEFIPVERKCHNEDMVIVDLIKKHDKLGKVEKDKLENVEIDLSGDSVLKEFKDGLLGMGIGEMKEIEVNYPDDYSDKQMAGNEVRYMAIVKEVKEKKLPPLDDEFAKNYLQVDTVEELKKTIKESLIKKADDDADISLKSSIIKYTVENNKFEVPESLVEKYVESVTEDFKKKNKDVDELELRQSCRPMGEDFYRWQFIYLEIAEKESIKVTESDRTEWIEQFAKAYNMSEKVARETLGRAGKFDDIDDSLLEKKVLDFIKDNSNITA
ncbi:MAG: trigger factor [candidate division Zixibacteria bacterium]|nr:trigger factor [candidate division Zixibacteria bacterium]